MNGWILKTLMPNIYNNHNYIFVKNKRIISYPGGSVQFIDRSYRCTKCNQYIELNIDLKNIKATTIYKVNEYKDCNESLMNSALI